MPNMRFGFQLQKKRIRYVRKYIDKEIKVIKKRFDIMSDLFFTLFYL